MNSCKILFFGSTSDSVLVLDALANLQLTTYNLRIAAVVTQPPRPVSRKQLLTPTPVETWAKAHKLTVLSFPSSSDKPWLFADEQIVIDSLQPLRADLIVTACFGQKIPMKIIHGAPRSGAPLRGGLNIHPSLLPRWRGADPVPWAIMSGDHQTGISIVTLAEKFDQGLTIAQEKVPITDKDCSDPLRTKLFALGADLLAKILPDYLAGKIKGKPQPTTPTPYARRLSRQDGFEPWEKIIGAAAGQDAARIERKLRALSPWPGLWTELTITSQKEVPQSEIPPGGKKKLKILKAHLEGDKLIIDEVQLEGKKPVSFSQFSAAYLQN